MKNQWRVVFIFVLAVFLGGIPVALRAQAATLTVSATWTPKLRAVRFLDSGDFAITFVFLDANGTPVRTHEYLMRADGSGVTEGGNQINATSPPSLLADCSSTQTDFNTVMANAIAAGKVLP